MYTFYYLQLRTPGYNISNDAVLTTEEMLSIHSSSPVTFTSAVSWTSSVLTIPQAIKATEQRRNTEFAIKSWANNVRYSISLSQ